MVFLIDGYNLLHPAGLAGPSLRAARGRMLDWLADAVRGREDLLQVVFDAQHGRRQTDEQDYRGIRVRFSFRQTADDLIEDLIVAEARPAELVIVSNDGRLKEAARRRGVTAWSCEVFMDWLAGPVRPAAVPAAPEGEKPASPTTDEVADLARVFAVERRPRGRGKRSR